MMMMTIDPTPAPNVILASASIVRKRLLIAAGINIITTPAHVDEEAVKQAHKADGTSAVDTATALAEIKALRISSSVPGALVIGADQILVCGGEWFDKPQDMDHAKGHLCALRGQTHELATAAVVVRDGVRIWHHAETPRLTMRPFTDAFIDEYLTREGVDILSSVGAYRLEGLGAQLFSRIEGDFFSILGLPLLALLDFLRLHRVVPL
ncbi:MAG: septum formation protein [Alphaproteobacteria bacterium]|jgi:septum formation protein